MHSKLDNLQWLEPPDSDSVSRPVTWTGWFSFLLALSVLLLLTVAGAVLFRSGLSGGWNFWWMLAALPLLAVGGFGTFRMITTLFSSAGQAQEFKLSNLELEFEILTAGSAPAGSAMASSGAGTMIQGWLRVNSERKKFPQSLTVVLELQPEFHPDEYVWLNSTYAKPDAKGAYEFCLEVPRVQLARGAVHGSLVLNFNAQPEFYRVKLEPMAQTAALEMVFQPSKKEQLEAFERGDASDLISRAYNGEQASAGWLRHNGGPSVQDFTLEEQSRVFTVGFAELVDHLEGINWFKDKFVDVLEPSLDRNLTLIWRQAGVFRIVYDQSDAQLTWFTKLHETSIEREAHEAFVLHSDRSTLALQGAKELLEVRSDGSGFRPAQSY